MHLEHSTSHYVFIYVRYQCTFGVNVVFQSCRREEMERNGEFSTVCASY
jgi:hypothetical protein